MGADIGKSLPMGMLAPIIQKAPILQMLSKNSKYIPKELPLGMFAMGNLPKELPMGMLQRGGK